MEMSVAVNKYVGVKSVWIFQTSRNNIPADTGNKLQWVSNQTIQCVLASLTSFKQSSLALWYCSSQLPRYNENCAFSELSPSGPHVVKCLKVDFEEFQ